jgi:hypothetical protein
MMPPVTRLEWALMALALVLAGVGLYCWSLILTR